MTTAFLFLPPAAVLLVGWLVWSGRWSAWATPPRAWSLLVWPAPAVALLVAPALIWSERALVALGLEPRLVPLAIAWMSVATAVSARPPRRWLPPWLRRRLAAVPTAERPPATSVAEDRDATAWYRAVRCPDPPAFGGTGPRWADHLDAVPGWFGIGGNHVSFEPELPPTDPTAPVVYTVAGPEEPTAGMVASWPLPDGRQVRAYPAPVAAAAGWRWRTAVDSVQSVRLGRRQRPGLARLSLQLPEAAPVHVVIASSAAADLRVRALLGEPGPG